VVLTAFPHQYPRKLSRRHRCPFPRSHPRSSRSSTMRLANCQRLIPRPSLFHDSTYTRMRFDCQKRRFSGAVVQTPLSPPRDHVVTLPASRLCSVFRSCPQATVSVRTTADKVKGDRNRCGCVRWRCHGVRSGLNASLFAPPRESISDKRQSERRREP